MRQRNEHEIYEYIKLFGGKIIKNRILKIGLYIITGILVSIFTIGYLLREPVVQTILARVATSYLSKELHTEIKIEKLAISSFNNIRLKNILIRDLHKDTLVFSEGIMIELKHPFYNTREIALAGIQLENAIINLVKYPDGNRSNLFFLMDYFSSKDSLVLPADTAAAYSQNANEGRPFLIPEITLNNTSFSYHNQQVNDEINGINFNDVAVRQINASLSDLTIHADTFSVVVGQLALKEKSGFEVDSLSCAFAMGNNFMQAKHLKATTALNKLDLDFLFSFNSMHDFQDFIHQVKVTASIRPSLVNLSEVGYFAPVMYPMDNRLRVSGDIKGTVDNFKARSLRFGLGRSTQFRGDVQLTGLPDVRETFTHLSVKDFTTTVEDVSRFNLPTKPRLIPVPEILARLGAIRIHGKFTGFYNDFVSYAQFKTGLGQIRTDLSLRVNSNSRIGYDGHLEAEQFDVGKFLGLGDNIGKLNTNASISGSGIDFEHMEITMDGRIDSMEFYHNLYNEIAINGKLSNKKFTGQFLVTDDLLKMDFTGTLDYSKAVPAYNFSADIPLAYLDKINLIKRDESSRLSTHLSINILGDKLDNMQGLIQLDSTVYAEKGVQYLMNDFTLSITRESDNYAFMNLYSDLLDASLEGNFRLDEMKDRGYAFMAEYFDRMLPLAPPSTDSLAYQDFIFNVTLKNTKALSKLFVPNLEASPGTHVSGGYNSQINNLFFDGTAQELIFNNKKIDDTYFDFYIQDSTLLLNLGARQAILSDTIRMDSIQMNFSARSDTIRIKTKWEDYSPTPLSNGELSGSFAFLAPREFSFRFDQADFNFANTLWHVAPENNMQVDSNSIQFQHMGFSSSAQHIMVHGGISKIEQDTLRLGFSNFDLSNFDLLLNNLDIDLDGYVNGNLELIDYYNSPFYLSDLHIDSLKFNDEKLGEAELLSNWNPESEAFDINGNIIYTGNIGKNKTLNIVGNYFPTRPDDNYNIDISLNKYQLTTLKPFLSSFSSEVDGLATGELKIRGSRDKPDITGLIKLMRCGLRIDYTNVKYFFADQVILEPNDIHFENIKVYDSTSTNKALLSGHIYHNHLKDFNFDLNISTSQLAGLNTTRQQNSAFYGKANASGTVKITGPVNNLNLALDIRSEKNTDIKIPVSYDTDVGSNDYIVFVNQDDHHTDIAHENIVDNTFQSKTDGVSLQLGMKLTNDASIQLFMPYSMGNIRAKGNGDIRMDIDQALNMNMDGEYVIDRGSFFFTLKNIINRTFDISRGSKVTWTGDPYNAKINLKALYSVKTTLGEYGPPEDSASRIPVDCIIELRNQLLDPEIKFSLEFPGLKEDSKQYIYSRLDTNDQAMMSQQMISLLVLNSFSSETGTTGNVGFNTFSLVTNQLNNWLSSISNDFDIGVNYRPGDDISAQEVEVALSTQLFNDRVLIDGNVGMKDNQSAENTNNIVGEVNVEVKVTPDGRFRAKAFNKSNNNYLYKNYSPYTQGVGIFYTEEFNKFSDLFVKKKKKKATQE